MDAGDRRDRHRSGTGPEGPRPRREVDRREPPGRRRSSPSRGASRSSRRSSSTGRHDGDDPAKDHRTRPGEYRIREKHVSATMDNDTATDGPYSIEDVPWIMYFDGSTALHGAFWHSRFRLPRGAATSCVNMTPHDAHELFGWVGPRLPEHWHGVRCDGCEPRHASDGARRRQERRGVAEGVRRRPGSATRRGGRRHFAVIE